MQLKTSRLTLVAQTAGAVRAWIDSIDREMRAQLSEDWLAQVRAAADVDPWVLGFVMHDASGAEVGRCGFKGPPDRTGEVEIAYGVSPEAENKGYATEAAAALLEFALSDPRVSVVCAHTIDRDNASSRVLEKNGFQLIAQVMDPDDGLVWRWEVVRKSRVESRESKVDRRKSRTRWRREAAR